MKHDPTESRRSRRDALGLTGLGLAAAALGGAVVANAKDADAKVAKAEAKPTTSKVDYAPFEKLKSLKPKAAKEAVSEALPPPPKIDFARSDTAQKEFENLISTLRSRYQVDTKRELGGLPTGIALRMAPFSPVRRSHHEAFLYLHVEPLLDQAADLLDRAIRDRSTSDDLSTKMLNLLLELYEFADLDNIHREEEAQGIYDVAWKQSTAIHSSESFNQYAQAWLSDFVQASLDAYWTNDQINAVGGAAQISAWLTGIVPYLFKDQDFDSYVQYVVDNVSDTVAHHAQREAATQSFHSLFSQWRQVLQQKWQFYVQAAYSDNRLPGLQAQALWDRMNAAFLRRRTRVARSYQDVKVSEAAVPDGILNYAKRLPGLHDRSSFDLNEAYARILVVSRGLLEVYGYQEPLPDITNVVDLYDNCLIWTRRAIQWLIAFSRREQSTVIPISVRSAVGEAKWCKSETWSFPINPALMPDARHVRLRGVSAYSVAGKCKSERLWQIRIVPPPTGIVRHLDGTTKTLDQTMLSPALVGRATGRNSRRDGDIVGLSAFYNASPFGQWTVEVVGAVPGAMKRSGIGAIIHQELCDVQIELYLAYRQAPS